MQSGKPERGSRLNNQMRGIFGLILVALASASNANQPADCKFTGLDLPEDFAVLAGGEYSGRPLDFQIDQSGHQATQMDVVVNYTAKPVVLILGAYEPTIWNIQWSRRTQILAVLTGGYHRQGVAGLPKSLPLQVRSYEDKSPCGHFYVGSNDLRALNPLSRSVFGRPVAMVYLAKNGSIVAGDPVPAGEPLETSHDTTLESFIDRTAPLAGPAGLRDAVAKGLIRPATAQDAEKWANGVLASTPTPDVPPVAGETRPRVERPMLFNAYVVLKPFTFPSGLYGGHMATFLIPKGVPRPQGNPGHSDVYDFNTLGCTGPLCNRNGSAAAAKAPAVAQAGGAKASAKKVRECSSSEPADSETTCLAEELKRTDDEINSVYQKVMKGLDPAGRKNLRDQQRAWLKSRDASCSLSSRLSDRTDWIAYLLADNARAVCVVRFTKERLAQLVELEKGETESRPPKIEATIKPSRSNLDYMKASLEGHEKGKWYFEVQIDHGKVPRDLEASLFIGVHGGESTFGTMYHIRPQDLVLNMGKGDSITIVGGNLGDGIRLPKVTIGMAADLDNGKLYVRRGGEWRNGVPGSSRGIDVKLGRPYKAGITSSVPLASLIAQDVVAVNFGDKPFADAVPDGYAVFDISLNASTRAPVRLATVEVVPPGSSVAAQPPAYWLQKYWEWSRSVAADQKPSADQSGAHCADRQSGPVWFLTGSESAAPVVRSCEIPVGMHVLVPIMNVLAQPSPGRTVACEELTQTLKSFGSEVADLRLMVDGVALQSPTLYRTATGCFELNDISRELKGMAAGDGYWIFLKPLPPGRHEIAFGGKYMGDGFTQDIKYLINVR